ncbi:MAG TPA: multicopper oxidase family protein [Candidatus Acidoferrales bacterium]|nr:multicopper oxidase family protein [Candidatus Acidoferrales bacterium]
MTQLGALAAGTLAAAEMSSAALLFRGKSQNANGSVALHDLDAPEEKLREYTLAAEPTQFEIPSLGIFEKWLYNGRFPGPEIRAREGERFRLTVKNNLPEGTTIHWHGIPLHNAMDGVPDVTQPPISPGGEFVYEFDAAPSGSFLYHSHFGLQQDRGLVGPLIIEEKKAHIQYDREHTVTLSDFLADAPKPLGTGMTTGGGPMVAPPYITSLINGRPPEAPAVFNVKNGERVRLRLINLSGATIYRFAIGGHPLLVTHTDGRPVEPLRVDALMLAPAERYDVLIEARNSGVWPIAASSDSELPPARAVLRYLDSNDTQPREGALPEGLSRGQLLKLEDLRGMDLSEMQKANRTFKFTLGGGEMKAGGMMSAPGMMTQQWTMNGQAYPNADPIEIRQGDVVRILLDNQSAMPHPMHLHGHFFRVGSVYKDTTIVWTHSRRVELNFIANNPGSWLFHCHNLYHMEGGMTRLVRYLPS